MRKFELSRGAGVRNLVAAVLLAIPTSSFGQEFQVQQIGTSLEVSSLESDHTKVIAVTCSGDEIGCDMFSLLTRELVKKGLTFPGHECDTVTKIQAESEGTTLYSLQNNREIAMELLIAYPYSELEGVAAAFGRYKIQKSKIPGVGFLFGEIDGSDYYSVKESGEIIVHNIKSEEVSREDDCEKDGVIILGYLLYAWGKETEDLKQLSSLESVNPPYNQEGSD